MISRERQVGEKHFWEKPASSLIPQATLALVCVRFCSLEQTPLHPRKLGERVKDCLFHKDPSQGQEI